MGYKNYIVARLLECDPCYGRSLLLVQIVLISVMIMTMMFHVIILLVLLYATILSYIACYCVLNLFFDISHALFHYINLAGPFSLFFFFTSFQVQVK